MELRLENKVRELERQERGGKSQHSWPIALRESGIP